jgi:hypothetical protein
VLFFIPNGSFKLRTGIEQKLPSEETEMLTRLISIEKVCKAVKRSAPYVRALADAGVIDAYVLDTKWRAFPSRAIEQIRAHEARKTKETVEA